MTGVPQLSVAVTLLGLRSQSGILAGLQPRARFAGHLVNVGASVSLTITVWGQVMLLPELSITVHITVFVPTGKSAGALFVIVTGPQLSDAVSVPRATLVAPHRPGDATTVTNAGQAMVGGWVSLTITVCGQVTRLPWLSVAVQTTVFVP